MKSSCLPCRVRHSKCDGEEPCAQCKLRKTECNYSRSDGKQKFYVWSESSMKVAKIPKLSEGHSPSGNQSKPSSKPSLKSGTYYLSNNSHHSNQSEAVKALKKMSLPQLTALVMTQASELNELDSQLLSIPKRHIRTEYLWQDIKGSDHGESDDPRELTKLLVTCYVKRNAFFYPNGTVPVDYPGAETCLTQVVSQSLFKRLLEGVDMQEMVEAFCYCIVFAYGAKSLYLWGLGQEFAIRAEALLEVMLRKNLIAFPHYVCKLLSLIGFHTIFLIGFGFEDIVRHIMGIEHYLFVSNLSHISVTLAASLYGNLASITADIPQRRMWLRKIEALNPSAVPPYYDAYRLVWLSLDILLQPSGIYDIETLSRPLTELETGWRQHLVAQGDAAIAKLANFPPYAFTDVDNVDRSIKTMLYGTKALNLLFLGNQKEAHALARKSIHELTLDDIPYFTTILMYSLTGTIQVAIMLRDRDLYLDGMIKLSSIRPEIPRTGAHLTKLHEQANYFGLDGPNYIGNNADPRIEMLRLLETKPYAHLEQLSIIGPPVPIHSISGIPPVNLTATHSPNPSSPTTSSHSPTTPSLSWPAWNYLPEVDLDDSTSLGDYAAATLPPPQHPYVQHDSSSTTSPLSPLSFNFPYINRSFPQSGTLPPYLFHRFQTSPSPAGLLHFALPNSSIYQPNYTQPQQFSQHSAMRPYQLSPLSDPLGYSLH